MPPPPVVWRTLRAADLDTVILRRAQQLAARSPALPALRAFSRAGEHSACWIAIAAAGALVDPGRRDRWARLGVTAAATYMGTTTLKYVIRRRRPELPGMPPLIGTSGGMSFPSSHAASSFASAGHLAELASAIPWHGVAAAMAGSRVALGVHYPSDVVAGAAIGLIVGRLTR